MIINQTNPRQLTRAAQPLIHCITNPISIHDCANIILAAGGRPIMAEHPAEVAEITRSSHALALNLGNITDARMKSMPESLKTAASLHIPVMLDLVGTACSNLRYEFAQKLMNIHMPELLKGICLNFLPCPDRPHMQSELTQAYRMYLQMPIVPI